VTEDEDTVALWATHKQTRAKAPPAINLTPNSHAKKAKRCGFDLLQGFNIFKLAPMTAK
jgi:hypothetical protein